MRFRGLVVIGVLALLVAAPVAVTLTLDGVRVTRTASIKVR